MVTQALCQSVVAGALIETGALVAGHVAVGSNTRRGCATCPVPNMGVKIVRVRPGSTRCATQRFV